MKEQGVKACIFHSKWLNTRSSILLMVLASNISRGSPTSCKSPLSDLKYSGKTSLHADQSNSNLTCNSTQRGTLVSSTLAAIDKQATDNNLTIQGLLVFMVKSRPPERIMTNIISIETHSSPISRRKGKFLGKFSELTGSW